MDDFCIGEKALKSNYIIEDNYASQVIVDVLRKYFPDAYMNIMEA
jgi:hypothetical protein